MESGCWQWTGKLRTGGLGGGGGYAPFWDGRATYAHRYMVEARYGPVPKGMQVDHLCRNRGCVNPDHLEIVTPQVNQLRGTSFAPRNASKTHCDSGHEFTPANTYMENGKMRKCRRCRADAEARRRALRRAA